MSDEDPRSGEDPVSDEDLRSGSAGEGSSPPARGGYAGLLAQRLADLGDHPMAVVHDVFPRIHQYLRSAQVQPVAAPGVLGELFRGVVEGVTVHFESQAGAQHDVHAV